jgi:predicted transcriptional regulator
MYEIRKDSFDNATIALLNQNKKMRLCEIAKALNRSPAFVKNRLLYLTAAGEVEMRKDKWELWIYPANKTSEVVSDE